MSSFFKKIYFFLNSQLRKNKSGKISYSLGGIDLLINHIFRDHDKGLYIDVGCNHPIKNNNTYLLYKRGWCGINVDLDKTSIDQFKTLRPNDFNINSCVSDSSGTAELYFYHDKSPINTIDKNVNNYHGNNHKETRTVKTQTLNSIIENSKFENSKINFLSIDVEGHEMNILNGFDLQKYYPNIVVIEFLDIKINRMELVNQNINRVFDSPIYKHMLENKYHLVNWLHSDLVFASNDIRKL